MGPDKDVSAKVVSDVPIAAGRPQYQKYHGFAVDGHNVVGASSPMKKWHFAEGTTVNGFEERITLQNPGSESAIVEVDYYTEEAGALPTKTIAIPTGTRLTVYVNDHAGPGYGLSCHLRVLTGPPVSVERPMYFDYRY